MAPIRDWTGAITISPLPYCEIAAVGNLVWGLPQPTLRGSALRLWRSPSCTSGFAFRLHGEIHNTPSLMAGLRSALSLPVGGHCVWVCV